MQNTLAYGIVLIGTIIWCVGIILPPLSIDTQMSIILYEAYHHICHQIPEHSLFINGHPLAVCVRCTSIYGGFLFGVLFFPLFNNKIVRIASYRYAVFVLALPMIFDVSFSWLTSYSPTTISRFITGGLFGVGVVFIIIPLLFQAVEKVPVSGKQYNKENINVT